MTFSQAVEAFIHASPWLGLEHMPALATLQAVAAELDTGGAGQAPLVSAFGLAYRNLLKLAPAAQPEDDPFGAALRGA